MYHLKLLMDEAVIEVDKVERDIRHEDRVLPVPAHLLDELAPQQRERLQALEVQ